MTSGTGDKVKGRMEKAAGELLDDDRLRTRGTEPAQGGDDRVPVRHRPLEGGVGQAE